jgi:nucleoside-diphosphate-sugar epimerase
VRAFITGATGFIGGALAADLYEAGWEVRLLARPSSLSRLASPERYSIIEGDLSRPNPELGRYLEGCNVLFHAAAIRDRYGTSEEEYFRVNVAGTNHLLEAALGRVGRFVHISSVGVYGSPGVLGINENFPLAPGSGKAGYHSSKAAAEEVVMERSADIDIVVARPTITYGPGDTDGMVTRLIAMIAAGKFIRVGNGQNHFHLTYISDMVQGLKLTGVHPLAPGQDFILAGPSPICSGHFVRLVEQMLGKHPASFYIPESLARPAAQLIEFVYRLGRQAHLSGFEGAPPVTQDKIDTMCLQRSFSSQKAQNLLGYKPRIGYSDGLKDTMKWMVSTRLLNLPGGSEQSLTARSKSVS